MITTVTKKAILKILKLDRQFFLWVNHLPHPPLLNLLCLTFDSFTRSPLPWTILSLIMIVSGNETVKKYGRLGLFVLLFTLLTEEIMIKKTVKRLRPFTVINGVNPVGIPPKTYSFPSGQVTNVFSLIIFFSLFTGSLSFFMLGAFFGLLVGFCRVYLAAHYPLDVLGGIIIGILCGLISFLFVGQTNH